MSNEVALMKKRTEQLVGVIIEEKRRDLQLFQCVDDVERCNRFWLCVIGLGVVLLVARICHKCHTSQNSPLAVPQHH